MSASVLPTMFEYSGMTQVEYDFVRTYVSAMKRDYYLLRSVLTMMNPKDLAVKSVMDAVALATKAATLHAEFEQRLDSIVAEKNYRIKQVATEPPISALADLFSLSFFTLAVKTDGKKASTNGFFSGEPSALADMLKHLIASNESLQKSSAVMQFLLILQLFPHSSKDNTLFEFWGSVADMFKYGSGLAHYGNYGQVYEHGYGNYEEDDEEDDYDEDYDDDYEDDEYYD